MKKTTIFHVLTSDQNNKILRYSCIIFMKYSYNAQIVTHKIIHNSW